MITYLGVTHKQLEPLYKLEKEKQFTPENEQASEVGRFRTANS